MKKPDSSLRQRIGRPELPAPDLRLQDTMRLSAEGLAKVLGDLELRVMRAVWHLAQPASARTVHARVARSHDVQLLTVITVLNKLVDKGLLTRAKQDDLFHYSAVLSELDFTARASRRAVEGVLSMAPDMVAASLVDVLAERDPAQLADLARLINERLQQDAPRTAESPESGTRAALPSSGNTRRKG